MSVLSFWKAGSQIMICMCSTESCLCILLVFHGSSDNFCVYRYNNMCECVLILGTVSDTVFSFCLTMQEKIDMLRTLGATVRPVPVVAWTDPDNYNHQVCQYTLSLPL